MTKWFSASVVLTILALAGCSSAPKPTIVHTDAPVQNNVAATNQADSEATEPAETAPPPIVAKNDAEESDEAGGIEGGVEGGVYGGVVVGVPGGVVGGVQGGVPGGVGSAKLGPDLPGDVYRVGNPLLVQTRCPHPGAPQYPQAAKDAKVETRIIAQCILETNGSLSSCRLVVSHPMFEKAMMDHLNKSKLTPMTTTDGKPARVLCNYAYRFQVE
jgi:protein TonB